MPPDRTEAPNFSRGLSLLSFLWPTNPLLLSAETPGLLQTGEGRLLPPPEEVSEPLGNTSREGPSQECQALPPLGLQLLRKDSFPGRKMRWEVSREMGPCFISLGPCSGPQGGFEALHFRPW